MAKFIADNQAAINEAMPNFQLIANGEATDAGSLLPSDIEPLSRGAGLLQTSLGARAAFSIQAYLGYTEADPNAVPRTILAKAREASFSPEGVGAVGDAITLTDGSIASGTAAFSSASAAFTAADVGKAVIVTGAGASGAALTTTITAYVSAGQVTLGANASTTVSGAKSYYGTDDSAAFAKACVSNRRVKLDRKKSYLVRNLTLMGLSNFELDGNKATIVSDRVQSILGFSATGWGVSKNIYVHDLSLSYATTPTTRNDNIFPLWFQYVDGVQVERVTVTNSWSAGVIFSACSNVKAYSNKISNTLADGMTCFGCGRNVTYFDNDFTNTSDDAMAVTWLAGNTAAAVGEVTIRTKGVRILYNRVNGTTVSARGVFIGGIEVGVIAGNEFYNVASFSILLSNTTTVATYSTDVNIVNNVCVNSGQAASSLVGEVGGIAVYSQNTGIIVQGNNLKNSNNVGMLLQGNVYATCNLINGVTNNPSTQNPSLPWQGAGAVWADFSGSNTCFGSFKGNEIWNTAHRAVWVQAGYNTEYLSICNNEIHNCVDPASVGAAALGVIFLDTSTRNQVIVKGNRLYESRTTQVLTTWVYVAGGGLHDIDHNETNLASGASQPNTPIANASGGTAIKRFLQVTISAGTIAANSTYSQNVSVAEASLRDYVFVSPPYQIPGLILTAFVQSQNVVTVQLTNPTTAAITPLQGNTWTVRVRRS
ncbi:right-handed parallel beta-helix repeat-containing protein [Paraburkholderia terricola]|uniref:right-handed parallel beta-helix repeat-containing protein n=1 Tax=Paraburkholderia terricola TaxID=169427 RepID=UPI003ECDAFD1